MLCCGKNTFEGAINVSAQCYYYHITLPNFPSLKYAVLHTSWNLKLILDNLNVPIAEFVESCESVMLFKKKLTEYIEESTKQRHQLSVIRTQKFYKTMLQELNNIVPFPSITSQLSEIKISYTDRGLRTHSLVLSIPNNYPDEPLNIKCHDLPLQSTNGSGQNLHGATTISETHQRFIQLIEDFQQFWDSLEVLDASCWVLEPQCPKLSDTFRRIQIAEFCSVLLNFDSYNAWQRPHIEFRGIQQDVDKFRSCLEKNLLAEIWEPELDVHLNLQALLELDEFPVKIENDQYNLLQPGECGICFEERLDDQLANLRCDNQRCESQFHQNCLLRYLSGNLTNVRMKSTVFGRCPACTDPIGCPIYDSNSSL